MFMAENFTRFTISSTSAPTADANLQYSSYATAVEHVSNSLLHFVGTRRIQFSINFSLLIVANAGGTAKYIITYDSGGLRGISGTTTSTLSYPAAATQGVCAFPSSEEKPSLDYISLGPRISCWRRMARCKWRASLCLDSNCRPARSHEP